ncbi:semaphorin-5A [Frankliniella occidentalis]|uniref:Semaphorin-5A n=1 Tax=Frankliniella occidentalis TaxID=133901 RepID=A0A6J1S1H8_FRAOC|nr:semaphorin-5A [Frankliniella occidentalis]
MKVSRTMVPPAPTLSLLLLLLLHPSRGHENEPPTIELHDLAADVFTDKGSSSFSELLFDVGREQVVVGARDALYRLSLRGLARLEKAFWPPPPEKASLCQDKGQSEEACHNYVKVLVSNGKRLFTCGTNAYSPQCTWREMENVNHVVERVPGLGKCPPNPRNNNTAFLSSSGQYYVVATIDFGGTDAALVRNFGATSMLRSNKYDWKWFSDPQFVGSFETDSHYYFVFRENAIEYMNCGKAVYSRIGRICKNDQGGSLMLKDSFTTFIKARLNCSLPGEFPAYFDEIQDMALLEDQKVLYATFASNRNHFPATAVCAFNMSAILAAFAGPFKYQGSSSSAWEAQVSPVGTRHFDCEKIPLDPRTLGSMQDSSRYQIMDHAIQPTKLLPLYHRRLERLTLTGVDVVPTKHHPGGVHVVYAATDDGVIKKMSVLPGSQETCILELWRPFTDKLPPRYRRMDFLRATESLYIGTEWGVMRIPAQHCARYKTRTTCLAAMDPYCGWNELKEACTPAPNRDPSSGHWQQNPLRCPDRAVRTEIVDGGWSGWSAWAPCSVVDGADADTSCQCRQRRCDNPAPANGGMPCHGETTSVTNCTVHGGWTAWSAWSACSQTCGLAVKTRKRTCGNPAPQHGGRICVGEDRSEIYCTSNPPCPAKLPPPQDGGWGAWTSWGECSSPCGSGFRVRRRVCDNPIPAHGGAECQGCPLDYEPCNGHPCPESRKLSAWTPWLSEAAPGPGNANFGGTWTEKRFRFACRAQTADPSSVRVTQSKEEKRVCSATTGCKSDRVDSDEVWSDWSEWSACSAECGGGFQTRSRTCEGNSEDCEGSPKMSRPCNMHRCKGEWSCWSEWSACSVSCGSGMRQRTRHCLSMSNKETLGVNCDGPALSQEPCESPSCESLVGWSSWTVWSECDENGDQHRRRSCETPGPSSCQGHDFETRMCVGGIHNGIDILPAQALDSSSVGNISVLAVLGCCFAGFVLGLACAAAVWYYHKRKRIPPIPSSPCYMSTKQNPYVTVPLKESISQKPKRTASFSSATSNGSHKPIVNCNSLNHPTPKLFSKPADYDTATIKRNSHSLNGNVRPDLEQEKFY